MDARHHTSTCTQNHQEAEIAAKVNLFNPDCPRCSLNYTAPELLKVCKDALKLFGEEGVWSAPKWMQIHRGEMLNEMTKVIEKAENPQVIKKLFYVQYNIGTVKYVVNFHDGKKTHRDGSKFYDIRTFKNKEKLSQFEEYLINQGYKLESGLRA